MKVYKVLGRRGRITIPQTIREKIGFGSGDIVSFDELDDGQSILIRKEIVCDGCSDLDDADDFDDMFDDGFDDGNGGEDMSLITDMLDGLSPEKQREALVHLSMRIANQQ